MLILAQYMFSGPSTFGLLLAPLFRPEPFIFDEQYSTPKPTPDPKSTDQPPSSEGSPGFGVVAALMVMLVLILIIKKGR
jgi:hypothetical protein